MCSYVVVHKEMQLIGPENKQKLRAIGRPAKKHKVRNFFSDLRLDREERYIEHLKWLAFINGIQANLSLLNKKRNLTDYIILQSS